MDWKKQGSAVVAAVTLHDGSKGSVVIVGARSNAKGAVIVIPGEEEGKAEKLAFADGIENLTPQDALAVLVMQERLHGDSGLEPPAELK